MSASKQSPRCISTGPAAHPLPGLNIPPQLVGKFDLVPKEITAALVGLKQRSATCFRMQRFINEFRGEPLMAVLPGVALDELWQAIGMVERTLLAISALVVHGRPRGTDRDTACRPQRTPP
jgi:hypothetical protein